MPTICLNMIVKNESKIISRLLDSVVDLIDSFCIIDTGSQDDTVSIIMDYFQKKNIQGKLGFTKFENFEKTRNYALQMASNMSDYILLLDADMILDHSIDKSKLDKDYYSIFQENSDIRYHNTRIVRNNNTFYYRGVTHEVILSRGNVSGEILKDSVARIIDLEDGGCKENKLERDKDLLLSNIEDEETQSRYYFYLANTLTALGEIEEAIKYYQLRIKAMGWKEELWCCCYKLGCIYLMKKDYHRSNFYFLEAYNYNPERVENLYYLVIFYKNTKRLNIAKIYSNLALEIIRNKDFNSELLFLEKKFYSEDLFSDFL